MFAGMCKRKEMQSLPKGIWNHFSFLSWNFGGDPGSKWPQIIDGLRKYERVSEEQQASACSSLIPTSSTS